jgi:hypothetical protein
MLLLGLSAINTTMFAGPLDPKHKKACGALQQINIINISISNKHIVAHGNRFAFKCGKGVWSF